MEQYLTRARQALTNFDAAAIGLISALGGLSASAKLPQSRLDKLREIAGSLPDRSDKVRFSLSLTEQTAVDIVDLQETRLKGQCASLAADLAALGDTLEKAKDTAAALMTELRAVEERAARVATAMFPNAIEGLGEINSTLWDFRLITLEYDRTFAGEVARTGKNRLTAAQLNAVRGAADTLTQRFNDVNELLNQLAVSALGDSATVTSVVKQARRALAEATKSARSRASDSFKPFHGVLEQAERLARKIDEQFVGLRVPVFPSTDGLEDLDTSIDHKMYGDLVGVERMALLNIAARLKSITHGPGADDHLLSPRFGIRVFDVFPDRIYFTVDAGFIATIEALAASGMFGKADSSLHLFSEGSYKQKRQGQKASRKGNLQVSFAKVKGPADRGRFNVDADIDLYPDGVRHIFREVLVNHLTGNTTDQFKVFDLLASADVGPIGDFDVVTA